MSEPNVSVSIIMPTYNRAYIISAAIDSVLAQTFEDFELIIVDDGSEDETNEVVANYEDDRIRYFHYKNNKGANHARNYGIRKSRGTYIAFLDSDNKWNKEFLKKRITKLTRSRAKVGFVWGPVKISQRGKKQWILPAEDEFNESELTKKRLLIKQLLFDNVIDTNAVVIKKECIERVDGFDESFKRLQDWELFLRILSTTDYEALFDSEILVKNFIQKDSLGSNSKSYWGHRVKLIQKNKKLLEELGCNSKLLCYLFDKEKPKKDREDLKELLGVFPDDSINALLFYLSEERKRLSEIVKIKNIESGRAYDLHIKEYGIIEFQHRWINALIKNENFIMKKLMELNVNNIAIYGYGWIGKNLYQILKNSGVKVTAIIDNKYAGKIVDGITIDYVSEFDDTADLVVVTVLDEFSNIKERYQKNTEYISINELV